MSLITDTTVQMCHQKLKRRKTMERRVFTVILNVYQSTGIEKDESSRQSLESHGTLDEIRRFYNKKFEEGHEVHRNQARAEEYAKPTKRGEYQNLTGVMGIAYNHFLDSETRNAYMKFEVAELLKFWTEKSFEIDPTERERPSLALLLEKMPEVISVPRSNKRVELKLRNGNDMLVMNLGIVWKLLRPSWCPHPHASLIEEITERMGLNTIGKAMNSAPAIERNDVRHEKLMEFELLLEASGERNFRSINLTQPERVLSRAFEPLLDMECGRNWVSRVT